MARLTGDHRDRRRRTTARSAALLVVRREVWVARSLQRSRTSAKVSRGVPGEPAMFGQRMSTANHLKSRNLVTRRDITVDLIGAIFST